MLWGDGIKRTRFIILSFLPFLVRPLRAMGYYGGWSVKPEMGFGNALGPQIVICVPPDQSLSMVLAGLRPWMPYLNRKVTQAIRIQIQQRADRERKEMVKTTVSKSSQKKTV